MPDLVRLHISPLTPELLPKLIAPSVLPQASKISFHTVQTFPERSYGYLDLPPMEAEKVKKKLNGTIFKGSKLMVEEAKPKKNMKQDAVDSGGEVEKVSTKKKGKKRKREDGVLPGHELSEDRKVKRGWTEPAGKKNKDKSGKTGDQIEKKNTIKSQVPSSSGDAECLFKTKLPENKIELAKKGKKTKKGKEKKNVVVHEFEDTEKHPSFLRNAGDKNRKPVADYDEERGWIDDEGNVVEQGKKSKKFERSEKRAAAVEASTQGQTKRMQSLTLDEQDDDETSSSGSSSDAESESEDNDSSSDESSEASDTSAVATESATKLAVDAVVPEKSAPHPLETLFKRPAPVSTPNKSVLQVAPVPFSFFDGDSAIPSTDVATPGLSNSSASKKAGKSLNLEIPQTPFTARDLNWRGQRSAAPTPDTAAPNKASFGDVWLGRNRYDDEDIEEEEEDEDGEQAKDKTSATEHTGSSSDSSSDSESLNGTPSTIKHKAKSANGHGASEKPKGESEFSKWFWEHRGESSRAWKKRKREAGKEKRQSENRRKEQSRD